MLVRAGLYHGPLDGYVGPLVEAAVRSLQRRDHLTVDGVAGPETLSVVAGASPTPQPARGIYIARPGDSLTSIAAHFGLTLSSLARLNGLDPAHVLVIGTHLRVPIPAQPTPAPVANPSLGTTPAGVEAQLDDWADRLGVSSQLVRALAWMESGFQPGVVSPVGARGVLQVMPSTRMFVEQVLVGHPIAQTVGGSIEVGVLYLRHLLGEFDGNLGLALGAWYEGDAAVKQFGLYQVTKPFVTDVLALRARM
jgi:N-acetylmuramoyl-L-alanine amidase